MSISWLTAFLDLPSGDRAVAEEFWCRVTESRLSSRRGAEAEFVTLLPATGDAYLRVQQVREGYGGLHLDLHIDPAQEQLAQAAARAERSGAQIRHGQDDLIVLDSPGGLTFCLVPWDGEAVVPDPTRQAGDPAADRCDQFCLDIPPQQYETECAFWADLTRWQLRAGSLPGFTSLNRPVDVPLRLLFQRRDQAEPGARVSAHLDFACDDIPAVAQRHVDLGARVRGRYPFWTTLLDPTGRPYCLTGRDPRTGPGRPPTVADPARSDPI